MLKITPWSYTNYLHITHFLTKSSHILNKNTQGAKKCKANQKQQLLTKKFGMTLRPRSLEYNDGYNVDNGYTGA